MGRGQNKVGWAIKMKSKLDALAQLREVLIGMEADLGLQTLSQRELDILYAVRRLTAESESDSVRTESLRQHPLVRQISQPTYNRAIKSLVEKGYLRNAPAKKVGSYCLGDRAE